MKITVLGASGGCGRWAVQCAAERGHGVKAIVRPITAYEPPPGVKVLHGEVTDPEFVASLDLREDVVLSCLGQRRASLLPWSKRLSPPDLVQTVARHLAVQSLRQLIWISAGGVGSSREQLQFPLGWMVRAGNVGVAYADLEEAEKTFQQADFPSLAVRPVTLTRGTKDQVVGEVPRYRPWSTIHRRSVARWMVDHAEGQARHEGSAILLGTVR